MWAAARPLHLPVLYAAPLRPIHTWPRAGWADGDVLGSHHGTAAHEP